MLIQMDNVERVYRKGSVDIRALRPLNLAIAEGDFTAIMGQSGSGKSTLLHILGCLDRPSQGCYRFDGLNISDLDDTRLSLVRNHKIGFVFQSFNLLPHYTVLQNIAAPLLYTPKTEQETESGRRFGFLKLADAEQQARVQEIAERVGLGQRLHHRPSELSGGEMQRVAIARALVTQPRVILADEPTGNLDSRTGQDIMNIFLHLHQQGNTIILVTHEQEVAEYTQRVIVLKDGQIEGLGARTSLSASGADRDVRAPKTADTQHNQLFWLLPALIQTALQGVLLHKLRSFLSILGIVFGIGAIIAMLAIGAGAKQEIIEQIESLGTRTMTVNAIETADDRVIRGKEQLSQGLNISDAGRLNQLSPFMTHLAPLREFSAEVQYQRHTVQANIIGTTESYRQTGTIALHTGRFLSLVDEREMQRVCVLGADVRQALFAFHNPIGEMVKIRQNWFRVIGTLENKVLTSNKLASAHLQDVNKGVYIPLSTSALFVASEESERIQQISIRIDEPEHVDDAARLIRTVLARLHHGADDYEVIVPRELLQQSQQAQNVFNVVMGSIAGISLLVGGIGIMNIMLATVTERTREIGIRRAIGASRRMILLQFLIETLVLTVVGGGLGVMLGVGGAAVITLFAGWRTVISFRTILLAFGISAVIGIVFGMYPASQGAKMDPIMALRYE